MKRVVAALLTCVMVLGLTACGGASKSKWTEDDFTFKDGSEEVVVEEGTSLIVWDDVSYLTTDFGDKSYEEYDGGFETNRGLEIGMTMDDFKKLYNVKNGYAVWELLSGEDSAYTSFKAYSNQEPSAMYDNANSAWLDIGYKKEGGAWKQLTDEEVCDVWFCEADMSDYDEVVILSVNFDYDAEVCGIAMYHITYNDEWVTWQDWAD